MRVYIAAPFVEQARMRLARDLLQAAGHEVTSSWIDVPADTPYLGDEATPAALHAQTDLDDVARCEWLILDTRGGAGRGGKDFEMGYALALGKKVGVVGERSHIFTYLPTVTFWPSWDHAIEELATPTVGQEERRAAL